MEASYGSISMRPSASSRVIVRSARTISASLRARPARELESPDQATKEGSMQAVRRGAAAIYKVLIAIFAAAVVVQIFLAGLGIFRALPGEDESVTSEAFEDK